MSALHGQCAGVLRIYRGPHSSLPLTFIESSRFLGPKPQIPVRVTKQTTSQREELHVWRTGVGGYGVPKKPLGFNPKPLTLNSYLEVHGTL